MESKIIIITILISGMSIATATDFKTGKIPNLLTVPMMLAGLIHSFLYMGVKGLGFSSCGLAVGIGIFIVPYCFGGMGGGDVKLMGAIGSLIGVKGVLITGSIAVILGFVYAIFILVLQQEYTRTIIHRLITIIKSLIYTKQIYIPSTDKKPPTIKFALPMAVGAMCYVYMMLAESKIIQNMLGIQFTL